MHLNAESRLQALNVLVSLFSVFLLVACGTSTTTNLAYPKTPQASSTPNKIQNTSTSAQASPNLDEHNVNPANITESIGSLRIQSINSFQCPLKYVGQGTEFPIDQLVLATNRMTYSQSEIQEMRNYVSQTYSAANFLASGIKPPSTLRWVSVGSVEPIPGTISGGPWSDLSCGAIVNLTNTGNTPIQISKVGVQLQEHSRQNPHQYHLINACSIKEGQNAAQCTPGFGGQDSCNTYYASIQLGLGEKNDIFSSVPIGAQGCKALTIAPANEVELVFRFSLAANIPKNLVYPILPLLTIETSQGQQTLSLPKFASTLTFASANQFSCYQLKGTTFVRLQAPVFNIVSTWCM